VGPTTSCHTDRPQRPAATRGKLFFIHPPATFFDRWIYCIICGYIVLSTAKFNAGLSFSQLDSAHIENTNFRKFNIYSIRATAALHILNRVNALVVPLRILQCLPLTARGPPSTGRSPSLTACAPRLKKLSSCCSRRCVVSEAFNRTVDPHRQNRQAGKIT